ncbi:ABC transporter ATP-binding protein [Nocardioides salarius]|uniref:ABC transporter ATP-binding protein n=1 Tax=Nocardioides salarius TaxID=374513 RepID=UPI0030FBFAC0
MSDVHVRGVRYEVDRPLLADIDLVLRAGEMTALSGPSGSGKTTLLSIVGGLLEPTAGEATYDGAPTWRGTGDPRPEVAFVLQVYGLVPILSARENVSVALRARGVDPVAADEQAVAALARFHIADLADRQVEELSGGQMQRVALARGLCVGAGVLLADEPTSELDEGNRALVLAELRREAERGAVVVVATHDPAVVDACDAHHALDDGRLVDHTEPVHLPGHPDPAPEPAPQPAPQPAPEPHQPEQREPEQRQPEQHPTPVDHSAFRRPPAGR